MKSMYLNTLRYKILPLHPCASHTLVWSVSPSHPWLPVRGWRHALYLYWDPEPHDTEQRDHSFQLVHTPSNTWKNCYISRHVPQYYKVEKFLSLYIQVRIHVSGNEPDGDKKSLPSSTFAMGNGETGVYIEKRCCKHLSELGAEHSIIYKFITPQRLRSQYTACKKTFIIYNLLNELTAGVTRWKNLTWALLGVAVSWILIRSNARLSVFTRIRVVICTESFLLSSVTWQTAFSPILPIWPASMSYKR